MMALLLGDIVWPALVLEQRLNAYWCILTSLLIEAAVLWRFLRMRPAKALAGSVVMNAVSAFCGALLLPVFGLWWEVLAETTVIRWFNWGTFNPASYFASWLIAVILSTIIEVVVLWLLFFEPWARRLIVVVLAANALTVGLAGLSLFVFAPT